MEKCSEPEYIILPDPLLRPLDGSYTALASVYVIVWLLIPGHNIDL